MQEDETNENIHDNATISYLVMKNRKIFLRDSGRNFWNAWTPTGPMAELTTEIFKKNLLSSSTRKTILQNEPRNKNITFTPPDMDKRIWNRMSRCSREHDKDIKQLLYRFSASIRPIDNCLRFVYASKPKGSVSKETIFGFGRVIIWK